MSRGAPEVETLTTRAARPIGILPRERVGIAGVTGGTVKWVDVSRACGAIETEPTGPWEIWFHFSSIDGPGQAPPMAGDRVDVRYLRIDLDRFKYVAHLVHVVSRSA